MVPYGMTIHVIYYITKLKQNGSPRLLICVNNNGQVHIYINSSVDFKHKGLGTFSVCSCSSRIYRYFFLALGNNTVTNGDGMHLKS